MNALTPLTILAAVLALVACGGGGTSDPQPATPCVQMAQVRVQLFGDSTMEGWDGATGAYAVRTPTSELQDALDARFGRGTTLVTSRAMSGTTARQLVAGTDGRNQPWPRSVDAEIVVVNHGINDATHGDDLATYKAALAAIVANPGGARLIFETPNAVRGADLAPFAQAMRDTGTPIADTFTLPVELGDWAHPTQAGYIKIVRDSLAPAVIPVVEQVLRCGL